MQIKIQNLTNEQLDEWVARARGWDTFYDEDGTADWVIKGTGIYKYEIDSYHPSIYKSQWAELIEEFKVSLKALYPTWQASIGLEPRKHLGGTVFGGKTPAIAICRSVIASVYGDFVEVSNG